MYVNVVGQDTQVALSNFKISCHFFSKLSRFYVILYITSNKKFSQRNKGNLGMAQKAKKQDGFLNPGVS